MDENPYRAPQSSESLEGAPTKHQRAAALAMSAKIAAIIVGLCGLMDWISVKTVILIIIPLLFIQLPALFLRGQALGWTFVVIFTVLSAWMLSFVARS